MVDAALTGDGFDRMAELAAEEIGRPVAIVVPGLDVALRWPEGHDAALAELAGFTEARVSGGRAEIPRVVELVVPVSFARRARRRRRDAGRGGDRAEPTRASSCTSPRWPRRPPSPSRRRASAQVAQAGGGLVEGSRRQRSTARRRCARRAAGVGSTRRGGAGRRGDRGDARPHEAMALIEPSRPGRSSEVADGRVYALLPAAAAAAPPGALGTCEGLAARLRATAPPACRRATPAPDELGRAVREAELVLEALARRTRRGA